jgi:outer membrane murein-binding lipoprotein Lpp
MRNICLWLALILPVAASVAGCGSSKDSLEKKLASLQEDVTLLQNEHDRMAERMQALEIKALQAAPQRAAKAESEEPARVVRPPLRVVRVTPGSENADAATDGENAEIAPAPESTAKRPLIKEYGKPPPPAKASPAVRAVSGTLIQDRGPSPRGS